MDEMLVEGIDAGVLMEIAVQHYEEIHKEVDRRLQ